MRTGKRGLGDGVKVSPWGRWRQVRGLIETGGPGDTLGQIPAQRGGGEKKEWRNDDGPSRQTGEQWGWGGRQTEVRASAGLGAEPGPWKGPRIQQGLRRCARVRVHRVRSPGCTFKRCVRGPLTPKVLIPLSSQLARTPPGSALSSQLPPAGTEGGCWGAARLAPAPAHTCAPHAGPCDCICSTGLRLRRAEAPPVPLAVSL